MGDKINFKELKREHPGRICICRPHLRDPESRRVVSWICLRTFKSINAAKTALKLFELDGVTDAVLISTNQRITIDEDLAAKYSKVFLGLEQ